MSCIYHFSLIACKQNALFGNFRRKIMSDSLFSAFSVRRLQAKHCFSRFLHFACERRTFFDIFKTVSQVIQEIVFVMNMSN